MAIRQQKTKSQEPIVLEDLLTVKDVAKMLQISPVRIYYYMRCEGLPSVKFCGARRIRPSELQQWLNLQNAS
ncbi:MAG TPA: helix-turn-helix domain-containing protein [Ktedonobacteraceae bacterium]|nr:helix-turn-helix domain-containing protein [Ktedonobacteraceae bacterium]